METGDLSGTTSSPHWQVSTAVKLAKACERREMSCMDHHFLRLLFHATVTLSLCCLNNLYGVWLLFRCLEITFLWLDKKLFDKPIRTRCLYQASVFVLRNMKRSPASLWIWWGRWEKCPQVWVAPQEKEELQLGSRWSAWGKACCFSTCSILW